MSNVRTVKIDGSTYVLVQAAKGVWIWHRPRPERVLQRDYDIAKLFGIDLAE